jgi:hypothetical protein
MAVTVGSTTTVKVNRAVRHQIDEAAAWGVFQAGVAHLAAARSRITPPPGRSGHSTGAMSAGGSVTLYMQGGETVAEGGPARSPADGASAAIVAVVGFPFPARFQEIGTAKQPAYPFLGPSADGLDAESVITQAAAEKWPR